MIRPVHEIHSGWKRKFYMLLVGAPWSVVLFLAGIPAALMVIAGRTTEGFCRGCEEVTGSLSSMAKTAARNIPKLWRGEEREPFLDDDAA